MSARLPISYACQAKAGATRCGVNAVFAYPAIPPVRWWALCPEHAKPHAEYVLPIGRIQQGERLPIWDMPPEQVVPKAVLRKDGTSRRLEPSRESR